MRGVTQGHGGWNRGDTLRQHVSQLRIRHPVTGPQMVTQRLTLLVRLKRSQNLFRKSEKFFTKYVRLKMTGLRNFNLKFWTMLLTPRYTLFLISPTRKQLLCLKKVLWRMKEIEMAIKIGGIFLELLRPLNSRA